MHTDRLTLPPLSRSMNSSANMDPEHDQHVHAAVTMCDLFLERLSSLNNAIFNSFDDVDDAQTLDSPLPGYFSTNTDYRETFAFVVAHEFRFRSWRHLTMLLQYKDILRRSVHRDLMLLYSAAEPGHFQAVGMWQSWDVVEARWPFSVPVETRTGDHVMQVCQGMWTALRAVAAAALENDAWFGPCEFDVLEEQGVLRVAEMTVMVPAETSVSRIIRYMKNMGSNFQRRTIGKEGAKEKTE